MKTLTTILLALLALPGAAFAEAPPAPAAIDWELAESYREFFSPFSGAATGKALKLMTAEQFLAAVKVGNPPLVLDVRTPGETAVLGITLPGSIALPMDEVFTPESLERLAGVRVLVVCQSGVRATMVAMALRHTGLDDVWILRGGTWALAEVLTPKTAY